jgi:hypothetical protein
MTKLYNELNGGQMNGSPQMQPKPMNPMNPIKSMMNKIKFAVNPNQAMADMINSNPQLLQLFTAIKNNGRSPQELFYEMAKLKGVNPDDILNELK